ncbi:hypothetical protein, partial [Sulfuriferula sp.]|uniref:hypothetical protein n=1 Tax=Sulfuriferula sp. TaxID=2025307 RepID=UPI00272F98E3
AYIAATKYNIYLHTDKQKRLTIKRAKTIICLMVWRTKHQLNQRPVNVKEGLKNGHSPSYHRQNYRHAGKGRF